MKVTATGPTLLSLLDDRAERRPRSVALTDRDDHVTYAELVERSTRWACELASDRERRSTPDTTVGILMDHSVDLVVSAWAVLRSGAAYLPLEPDYPEQRVAYMVADSGVRTVLTSADRFDRVRSILPSTVAVVVPGEGSATGIDLPKVRAGDLAYVVYTSGSSGRPKGVAVSHAAVGHQLAWLGRDHLASHDRILHKTPISFDAAQWELLANATGACVVLGEPGLYRDPEALLAALNAHDVTALQAVPTLLRALVATESLGGARALSRIFSGGEPLTSALARDVLRAIPGVRLTNLYGPTEFTINATSHVVDVADVSPSAPPTVPIGRPVDGCAAVVVDKQLQPVGPGEVGELLLAGPQLARGYIGRPDLTDAAFITVPAGGEVRHYRTGDLVRAGATGELTFVGRSDTQVKLRGHRIELDEVSHRIEEHPWVRQAATVVVEDPRSDHAALMAAVELDPQQAALMDQGAHGAHHQSKADRVQVRAQLSNPGLRDDGELANCPAVPLNHRAGTQHVRRQVFSRKTYRQYLGGTVTRDDLLAAIAAPQRPRYRRDLSQLTFDGLSELLRWFGQFDSDTRLLPKFAYASPGALYATQLLVEVANLDGIDDGIYYYHPERHGLYRIGDGDVPGDSDNRLRLHFLGRRDAIETVYRTNVDEVLEIEMGHMLGTLEEALVDQGLDIVPVDVDPARREALSSRATDVYLGGVDAVPQGGGHFPDLVRWFVQVHNDGVDGLAPGFYGVDEGHVERIGDDVVEINHVIAINQETFRQSRFAVTMTVDAPGHPLEYVALGRALHRLQANDFALGLMSAGYSSRSGHPLPAAVRIDRLLSRVGISSSASYFAVGGRLTQQQIGSEGMDEDKVHMRGPAELIKDDLGRSLPYYMVPTRITILDHMPQTPNGKIDRVALVDRFRLAGSTESRRIIEPRNRGERWLAPHWSALLGYEDVSVEDDFFVMGGDSLKAVSLINRINAQREIALKVQTLFRYPRFRDLVARIDELDSDDSRLIPLNDRADGRAVFCWPGLGGSPMGLRRLGAAIDQRPMIGVQAWGINAGEEPFTSIDSMARADIDQILSVAPDGPYTLWGYSFGARVAFEAAWQLEQSGRVVDDVVLLCPGNPTVEAQPRRERRVARYQDATYLRILYSVFGGTIRGEVVERCVREVCDEDGFVAFMAVATPELPSEVVRRIARIVERTFQFEYTFAELAGRTLNARVTILKATGDDYTFLDGSSGYSAVEPTVLTLRGDHYSLIAEDVGEVVDVIAAQRMLGAPAGSAIGGDPR
ncbi:non-ribosomal peptide synthetase family protein [Millisia brevis]|uniref:non-ribosomal peptide synthetase family protein n=1 Tax=Millisia brevis TaxID=264148 RepID=UPI000830B529|nr:amino acid adenylation domain-containing protein [Millisia brevis]